MITTFRAVQFAVSGHVPLRNPITQHLLPVFRAPDHVVLQIENCVRALTVFRHSPYSRGLEWAAES
jgi:hypothetical protein